MEFHIADATTIFGLGGSMRLKILNGAAR